MTAPLALVRMAELGIADGVAPVRGLWHRRVDERWTITLNGSGEALADPDNDGIEIPAYNAYVTYNGWPAGIIGPHGGVLAAGAAANEDTLITALEHAIREAGAEPSTEAKPEKPREAEPMALWNS